MLNIFSCDAFLKGKIFYIASKETFSIFFIDDFLVVRIEEKTQFFFFNLSQSKSTLLQLNKMILIIHRGQLKLHYLL